MELYKNVHQMQSLFGGRNLFQYLFVGENIILVDTGIAETPEEVIFPYLDHLKIRPEAITFAIVTHPDLDHQGGNDAIKRASPRTLLACGEADRALVEHPQTLFDVRYNFCLADHGVGIGSTAPWPECGSPRKVDASFSGGEQIWISGDWYLEVLRVPGHSRGHLALYDRKHKAAYISDALHGRGCPKADGTMGIPVTYYYVDTYLSTLRYLESLPLEALYTGHFPALHGDQIRDFISESRQCVELFDRVILSSLERQPAGLTLRQLIDAVANAVGDWPSDTWNLALYPVIGHLDRLEQQGKIRHVRRHQGSGGVPELPVWQTS